MAGLIRLLVVFLAVLPFCAHTAEPSESTEEFFFSHSSADLGANNQVKLRRYVRSLTDSARVPNRVEIVGLNDDAPLRPGAEFRDQRQLSQARADHVRDLIIKLSGWPADRFVTRTEIVNVDPNDIDTEWDRSKYRKAVVVTRFDTQFDMTVTNAAPVASAQPKPETQETITLTVRNTDIAQVYEMLSRQQKVNILLASGVTGQITVNLYNVTLDFAVRNIADMAGYAVEMRGDAYVVLDRKDVGQSSPGGATQIKAFRVHYNNPTQLKDILGKYLSRFGKLTVVQDRNSIIVEDLPEYLAIVEDILRIIDDQPRQILIEAKLLEITLNESETFGINWNAIFTEGGLGIKGFANTTTPGFFAEVASKDIEAYLNALNTRGRVRGLAAPKLLAIENQESSVIIGDRQGYKVTTTINNVTSESVEFLESGVILKVTPTVDWQNRIILKIHPEISSGNVAEGIPSQTTTEVTTQVVAKNGQSIFIGGLIKTQETETRSGVPVLSSLPVVGGLFKSKQNIYTNTETVVLITPYLMNRGETPMETEALDNAFILENEITSNSEKLDLRVKEYVDPDSAHNQDLDPMQR